MAFHFDARADSSDEDGAIDLSAWKAGAKRALPVGGPAPVAPMMGSSSRQDMESSASPGLSDFQNGRGNKKAPIARSPPRPAFQPINDVDQESSHEASELDIQSISSANPVFAPDDQEARFTQSPRKRKLVVHISRSEGFDRDDYEDYTSGSQRVLRVLWEVRPIIRQEAYQVVFDDFHEEAVSLFT